MTENDVIKWIEAFKKTYKGFTKDSEVACDMAISALKEIQQYRLIQNATIGEIAEVLKEFSEIGTVEECREAVEKQKPKKIENWNGQAVCPNCKSLFGNMEDLKKIIFLKFVHCKYCGQAIKWEKEDME